MTIGDVLAVIAAVFVLVGSCVAAMLIACLLFPNKVQAAKTQVAASPAACGFRGFFIVFICVVLGMILTSAHFGGAKLLGLLIVSSLAISALVGGAAIVDLIADRMVSFGTQFTRFSAVTRAGILYAFACLIPGAGWLLLLPICLCVSVGAGIVALQGRATGRRIRAVRTADSATEAAQ